ncbi:MAG: acyl-CoA dehydratase activase-related protein [Clostridiales Family XIII bacterium]|jgi:predicted nucleotide-binding protein (sugar kinase/HSP70/actin superfamily)|nr:acyl-CoA dehydratase activase-related protein [Clostridiales Family XIII bacterium]
MQNIKKSSILNAEELINLKVEAKHKRCGGCENNCFLTVNKFSSGKTFITGNRCENFNYAEIDKTEEKIETINLFEKKTARLFSYEPLDLNKAKRGEIGIPRVLNMYENYPFWFTLFTELSFRVILSDPTRKSIYESGMSTISSDTLCYPAKIANGAIMNLFKKNVKIIFYPAINFEEKEDIEADNHFNCPVVATYPETIRANMKEKFREYNAQLISDFIPYDNKKKLAKKISEIFNIPKREVKKAVKKAILEDKNFKSDIRKYGEDAISFLEKKDERNNDRIGIVLAGRPYHLDREVNHGLDTLITSLGFSVLTEDSIAHLAKNGRKLRVLDQWMYHSRLYRAADFVKRHKNLELIQLNSFGCGPDAVTVDQVKEILREKAYKIQENPFDDSHKLYTVLKIDEGNNLGAAKIRLRSLKSALLKKNTTANTNRSLKDKRVFTYQRKHFTKEMKKDYTLIMPQLAPYHFHILEAAISSLGYNVVLLPDVNKNAIEEGLRYINNDACYPTIVALGQIISFLKSGKVDLDKAAIFMSQTGGGCRASNYIALLRKALSELGLSHIPVVSVSVAGLEKNEGFKFNYAFIKRAVISLILGDVLMQVTQKMRPYELNSGETDALCEKWTMEIKENMSHFSLRKMYKFIKDIVFEFDSIEITNEKKTRVGIVGEILVKYHPTANNNIVGLIEKEGGEAVTPSIIDFFLYGMINKEFNLRELSGGFFIMLLSKIGIRLIEGIRNPVRKILAKSKNFEPPAHIRKVAKKASQILSIGNQCGEGWLLTGEMVELIDSGVLNIVCLQPFACLPNHITGKGMLKSLREYNKKANIVPIDYDSGASEVNQINRIKLMMANAL